MCKEMPVIPVNKVVDPKRIIGKNGGPRRRRGWSLTPKNVNLGPRKPTAYWHAADMESTPTNLN
jgi:hypothetical protein